MNQCWWRCLLATRSYYNLIKQYSMGIFSKNEYFDSRKCSWNCHFHLWSGINSLTHWGWVTHICISEITIIGSDNGLSPGRRQTIIWTNAGLSLIGPLGTNFNEILIEIHKFSFKKIHLKMSAILSRPQCVNPGRQSGNRLPWLRAINSMDQYPGAQGDHKVAYSTPCMAIHREIDTTMERS